MKSRFPTFNFHFPLLACAVMILFGSSAARGDEPGNFELHNCVILISDPAQPTANHLNLFKQTCPSFVTSTRPAAPASAPVKPSPVGVIAFQGAPGQNVDVLLAAKSDRPYADWPHGEFKTGRLLWKDLTLSEQPSNLRAVGPAHWFSRLRQGNALYLTAGKTCERFLLYDMDLALPASLRIKVAGEGYAITLAGSAAVHDVMLLKHRNDGWHAAGPFELRPPAASAPASQPAAPGENVVTLAPAALPDADAVLAPLRACLAATGLADAPAQHALETLKACALDPHQLTVIYRLDPAEMDRLMPLSVTPEPRRTIRVGLVVLHHFDPEIENEIDTLIAQLGDASWKRREAAQTQLIQLGKLIKPKIEAALKHADVEIASRAEQILEALSKL